MWGPLSIRRDKETAYSLVLHHPRLSCGSTNKHPHLQLPMLSRFFHPPTAQNRHMLPLPPHVTSTLRRRFLPAGPPLVRHVQADRGTQTTTTEATGQESTRPLLDDDNSSLVRRPSSTSTLTNRNTRPDEEVTSNRTLPDTLHIPHSLPHLSFRQKWSSAPMHQPPNMAVCHHFQIK